MLFMRWCNMEEDVGRWISGLPIDTNISPFHFDFSHVMSSFQYQYQYLPFLLSLSLSMEEDAWYSCRSIDTNISTFSLPASHLFSFNLPPLNVMDRLSYVHTDTKMNTIHEGKVRQKLTFGQHFQIYGMMPPNKENLKPTYFFPLYLFPRTIFPHF